MTFDPTLLAGAGTLVVLAVAAVLRVLTHDRDESAIIAAWRQRAEDEQARADRLQERLEQKQAKNAQLRQAVNRLEIGIMDQKAIREAMERHEDDEH